MAWSVGSGLGTECWHGALEKSLDMEHWSGVLAWSVGVDLGMEFGMESWNEVLEYISGVVF